MHKTNHLNNSSKVVNTINPIRRQSILGKDDREREREMRERFEFGFSGEMAGVSFRNAREKVEIGQSVSQEEEEV